MKLYTKLYTKRGDAGETTTLAHASVPKDDTQVLAVGALDMLSAQLALLYEQMDDLERYAPAFSGERALLVDAMHDLLDMGTHVGAWQVLYSPHNPFYILWGTTVPLDMALKNDKYAFQGKYLPLERLEEHIDALCASTPPLAAFILCTGSTVGAHAHCARTACRQAESAVLAVVPKELRSGLEERDLLVLRTLNRLSDYLFALARAINHTLDRPETEHH